MCENGRFCRIFMLQSHPRTVLDSLLFCFLVFHLLTSLVDDAVVAKAREPWCLVFLVSFFSGISFSVF